MMKNYETLEKRVYTIPAEVDREIAQIKLDAMGVNIDTLTEEQFAYLNQWQEGT